MTAKTLDAAIGNHVDGGNTTLAWAIGITRPDATALRWCTGVNSVVLGGDNYTPFTGATISSISNTLGLNVDNLNATLGDTDEILREDVIDGVWDGCRYRLFQYNQLSPSDGIVPWNRGFIANIEPLTAAFDVELHDLRQALHQDTTRVFQFLCPYELGDAKCRKDLTAFTLSGLEVTVATNNQTFTTNLAEAAGWATEGKLLFTTGDNANGIWRKVTLHAGGGVLTLDRATIYPVVVGDLFTIIAGCQHRPNEDCRDKFANKVNYGGCDTKPTVSELSSGKLEGE